MNKPESSLNQFQVPQSGAPGWYEGVIRAVCSVVSNNHKTFGTKARELPHGPLLVPDPPSKPWQYTLPRFFLCCLYFHTTSQEGENDDTKRVGWNHQHIIITTLLNFQPPAGSKVPNRLYCVLSLYHIPFVRSAAYHLPEPLRLVASDPTPPKLSVCKPRKVREISSAERGWTLETWSTGSGSINASSLLLP
jgi:hypothetical protein